MVEPVTAAALSAVATTAIQHSTARFVDTISLQFAKEKYDVLRFVLNKGLPQYLAANYAKCQTLKTLLNRNDPIALEDCFVAPDFKLRGAIIASDDFLKKVSHSGSKVIITGLAGSGKSVFLKYSFRRVIEKNYSYYPVFYELRSLNGLSSKKGFLLSEVFQSIRSCCDSFTRAQFNYALKSGAFCFLLDGFDELKQEIREQVSSEITALARDHHKCATIVTSRPSTDFVSWEGFTEATLQPFDLVKAIDYISKLQFDEEKKKDFLDDLQGGLFESNKDFLSNPLLCAMMLLTYDSFGEIPEKRHTFYAKCFDVLAREHDASKGRYKRELFSQLAMDQLEDVFMFFCAMSYVERQFSFSDQEMEKLVESAISSCGADAEVAAVVRDFTESISIMEMVGLNYEFAHRSFQEYFYAKFVITDRKLTLEEKIEWLCSKFEFDDTIDMIADMEKTYFEDEFLLPYTKALDAKLSKVNPDLKPAGVLSKFYTSIHVGNYEDRSEEEGRRHVYFTLGGGTNPFIWRQAGWKYREFTLGTFAQTSEGQGNRVQEEIEVLIREFGGEIKIHHANNKKLIKVGACRYAKQIKESIALLKQHLEAKQERRKRGLGGLIRSRYGKGKDTG